MANKKPEKLVETEVLYWGRVNGFTLDVVESKAAFVPSRGHYRSVIITGFPDLVGADKNGHSVYIELKAKGKIKTIKKHQREFIYQKIMNNCFAVCVDNSLLLSKIYGHWMHLRSFNHFDAKAYLIKVLP